MRRQHRSSCFLRLQRARFLLLGLLLCSNSLFADDKREFFALVVGVGKYPPTKFRNLPGAEPDADDLAKTLIDQGYPKENVTVLTNSRGASEDPLLTPNAENIRREIDLLLDHRQPTDVVMIAMAGHGLQLKGEPYVFCPFDADPEQKKNLLSIDEIYRHMQKCKAEFKLLLVDACREETLAPAARNNLPGDGLASKTRGSIPQPPGGCAAFFSCTQGQVARERVDDGSDGKPISHGVFFHAVIRGLKGDAADKQGELTLPDLEKFVKRDVEAYSRATLRAKQYPELLNQTRGLPSLLPKNKPQSTEITSAATGIKLKLIPAGEFEMGSRLSEQDLAARFARWDAEASYFTDERPPHRVKISRSFYLGQYEVTVGQFRKFVNDTGYKTEAESDGQGGYGWVESKSTWEKDPKFTWKNAGFPQTDDHPVVNVSWNDAKKFCEWLSRKEGLTYRLPTEAEWEYACKAGTNSLWSNGDDPESVSRIGNIADGTLKAKILSLKGIDAKDGYVFTAPVGKFAPNPHGLYDLHGNVLEWCEDVYDAKLYTGRTGTTVDPQQSTGSEYRVLRGGSWGNGPHFTRSAFRLRYTPGYRCYLIGFRISRTQ